ncbi:MAG TPA: hypothetical protein VGS13_03260 [Stellaceae bacterium]|nr:hypothetical protein [Stellaceae bacterium]
MASDATPFFDDAARRAARWLAEWDAQGVHRTATAGDAAGADWLAREAAAQGAAVSIEEFALDRLDPVAAFLEIGTERIAAVPAFDAPSSDRAGVTGRLGPVGGDADIAVAELSPRAVYSGEFARLRRLGNNRGFVIVCSGESPGMGLLNAEQFREPYGVPTIHVASEAGAAVMEAAARGVPARLVAHSRRSQACGRNVVIALDGTGGAEPPLVVMTPRSSWWQSTAERGGGIVCWLESLRAVLAIPTARPVIFTANSGHELGHLGLDDFVARRPGWEERASWVHYGANIGAAGGALSLVSPDDDLRQLAALELARAGQSHLTAPKTLVPSGETRDIHNKAGRYLTLVGTNPLFHLPQDRWPEAVEPGAVTRIAAAAARIVLALTCR